ncbi:MAG: ABC transporter permease [Firmicutes bacterium]|nr:ABC transporter permease [Bacillota bacterium]
MRGWAGFRRLAPAALTLAGVMMIWQAAVAVLRIPAWLLPAPSRIAAELFAQQAPLAVHSARTLLEALLGLGIALALGVLLGSFIERLSWLRRAVYPLLVLSQTVPLIVLAPLLVIWFGYGLTPKILVVVLACFFPVVVNTITGLESADPDLIQLFRSMGASPNRIFRMVQWPSAVPAILSGTRVAASYSVMAAVVAEWMGSDSGLGVYIVRSAHSFLTSRVFAGIVLISLFSVVLFVTVERVERLVVRWRDPESEAGGQRKGSVNQ